MKQLDNCPDIDCLHPNTTGLESNFKLLFCFYLLIFWLKFHFISFSHFFKKKYILVGTGSGACRTNSCGAGGTCVETAASYFCECPAGYYFNKNQGKCVASKNFKSFVFFFFFFFKFFQLIYLKLSYHS